LNRSNEKKILIIHNKYANIGGEDIAVQNESSILSERHNVKVLYFENKVTNFIMQFFYFCINSNLESKSKLIYEIKKFKPDIVYVHNTWFKASTGIFSYLKKMNIPTIIKVHNFRFFCTSTFLSSRHVKKNYTCEACGYHNNSIRVFNKYFKNSYIKSFFVILHGKKFNRILNDPYFKVLVLTEYQKNFMRNMFEKNQNISVLRNIIQNSQKLSKLQKDKKSLIYAGRISKEKGVEDLIKNFLKFSDGSFNLKIAGEGPSREYLQNKYQGERIIFLGQLTNEKVIKEISKSYCLITFTKLYEGQPTIVNEASINGIPSIFPNNGGIHEFFPPNYPLKFQHNNESQLQKIFDYLKEEDKLLLIGNQNREFINKLLDKESWFLQFLSIVG